MNYLKLRKEQRPLDMAIKLYLQINRRKNPHRTPMKLRGSFNKLKIKDLLLGSRDKYWIFHVVNKIQQYILNQSFLNALARKLHDWAFILLNFKNNRPKTTISTQMAWHGSWSRQLQPHRINMQPQKSYLHISIIPNEQV